MFSLVPSSLSRYYSLDFYLSFPFIFVFQARRLGKAINTSQQRKLHLPIDNDRGMILIKEMMNQLLAYSRDVVRKKIMLNFSHSTSFAQWLNDVSNINARPTTADVHLWHAESKVTSILSAEDISLISLPVKHISSKMPHLPANLTVFEKLDVTEQTSRKRNR